MRQTSCIVGVLEEDRGLGISVGDTPAMAPPCRRHDLFRCRLFSHNQMLLARHLRDFPVLTPLTAEIAARGCDGIGGAAWIDVKQWLLFHRIYMTRNNSPIDERIERAITIFAHLAYPAPPIGNHTAMGTQVAAHPILWQLLIQPSFPSLHLPAPHRASSHVPHTICLETVDLMDRYASARAAAGGLHDG